MLLYMAINHKHIHQDEIITINTCLTTAIYYRQLEKLHLNMPRMVYTLHVKAITFYCQVRNKVHVHIKL